MAPIPFLSDVSQAASALEDVGRYYSSQVVGSGGAALLPNLLAIGSIAIAIAWFLPPWHCLGDRSKGAEGSGADPGGRPPPAGPGAGEAPAAGGPPQDPRAAPRPAARPRTAYLDALKVFLTMSVVTFHVSCLFGADVSIDINMYFCKDISGKFTREGCMRHVFIEFVAKPFIQLNNSYFMFLFFFISGFFTPGSLDKKGLRLFMRDRVKRLGLPAVAWYLFMGPVMYFFSARVAGGIPFNYGQHGMWLFPGPPWFVVVLVFFNAIYGCVRAADNGAATEVACPRVGTLLGVGVVLGLVRFFDAPFLVFMNGVEQCVNSGVFFWAGITARRNGWLQQLEQLPAPAIRFLRALTLLLVFLIWLFVAISYRNDVSDAQLNVLQGVFSVSVSLTLLDLFRRVFTSPSRLVMFMSDAAYTVYLIHPWVLTLAVWAYAHVLRACGVAIGRTCPYVHPGMTEAGQTKVPVAYLVEAEGEGLLWLGWGFVWSVAMLVVWPLAYGIAKLPGLRQIL